MIYTIRYPQDESKKYIKFRYPAGEVQIRLAKPEIIPLYDAEAVHVIATIKDGEVMSLLQLMDAIDSVFEGEITLIMPYLPYARADRPFLEGDAFGLQVFHDAVARSAACHVVTLDAHSEVAEHFFKSFSSFVNVSPFPLIKLTLETLSETGRLDDTTILLPDKGADRYNLVGLQCEKDRSPITGALKGFKVPPKHLFGTKKVLIIDDICDGGGTFVGIAEALKEYDLELYLYVTHGIFSKGFDTLGKYFKHIYVTDSFTPSANPLLTIFPCMGVILSEILTPEQLWRSHGDGLA